LEGLVRADEQPSKSRNASGDLCKQIIERRYAGALAFARLRSNRIARTKIQRQTTND
jgi:hypothetical protein